MKEMFPHPCPRKDKFQWIMGVRPVVQAAPAVIQALLQVSQIPTKFANPSGDNGEKEMAVTGRKWRS
ncbi:hypothetical protein JHK87_055637 [Glycine soja]|nr:hypothetical protein JHK87_055637 [Glycine soja]